MKPKRPTDKQLGIGSNISRRDFINTTLLGVGSTLLGAAAPLSTIGCADKPAAIEKDAWSGYGAVGDYANSSGNTKKVMEAAHKIRDGVYSGPKVDSRDTGEIFDLVIVGGGMSGLGAAHFFNKNASDQQRCLLIENHPIFGGEAKRNEFKVNGQLLIGPQGSNDFGIPEKGSGTIADKIFNDLNIPREFEFQSWSPDLKPLSFALDNYAHMTGIAESKVDVGYFFKEGQGVSSSQWINNIWRNDLADAPYSEDVKRDLLAWRYYQTDQADENYLRLLDSMTYKKYLEEVLKFSPEVTNYTEPVIGLINGASSDAVSAFAAYQIGMPGVRSSRGKDAALAYSFPGGNSAFARYLVKDLIPGSIGGGKTFEDILNQSVNFGELDKEGNKIRMRLGATVARVEHDGDAASADHVNIIYEQEGTVYQIKARSIIMASGGWVNRNILRDLPDTIKEAYTHFNYAPALIANVALSNWRFMYKLGITAAQWFGDGFGFSCNLRRTMNVGDYRPPLHPDKPTILTFYMGSYTPGLPLQTQNVNARWKIFGTTFYDYERQLREQMLEQFGASGFDPEKDIAGIILNRWGHARLAQQPGYFYGVDGKPAPREIVANGYGRVIIGHSELNGHQNWTGGLAQGYRAAELALGKL